MPINLSPVLMECAQKYSALELRVNAFIQARTGHLCAGCASVCCKADICREAPESAWLRAVAAYNADAAAFDEASGYMGPRGCRLQAGRPPLCSEFFCDSITQKAGPIIEELRVAGSLLNRAGAKAWRGRHLVTIEDDGILAGINAERLRARIDEALLKMDSLEAELAYK